MERRYPDLTVLGTGDKDAYVWLGSHLLGLLFDSYHFGRCGLWRTGILSRMVQDYFPCRLLFHLDPCQRRRLWQWIHWLSVLDSS